MMTSFTPFQEYTLQHADALQGNYCETSNYAAFVVKQQLCKEAYFYDNERTQQ
jgi:hypothetical protein